MPLPPKPVPVMTPVYFPPNRTNISHNRPLLTSKPKRPKIRRRKTKPHTDSADTAHSSYQSDHGQTYKGVYNLSATSESHNAYDIPHELNNSTPMVADTDLSVTVPYSSTTVSSDTLLVHSISDLVPVLSTSALANPGNSGSLLTPIPASKRKHTVEAEEGEEEEQVERKGKSHKL